MHAAGTVMLIISSSIPAGWVDGIAKPETHQVCENLTRGFASGMVKCIIKVDEPPVVLRVIEPKGGDR